jgi:Lrp/AsnC family leucine-responsive transcriptional regulator
MPTPTLPLLDELDHRILAALQDDASLSNLALAAAVHASPPTCLRRVRRLVDAGVIEKQVAILAPDAFGPTLTAIIEVTLDHQGDDAQAAFEARAIGERAVRQCYRVSPGPDFVLIAQVADMPGYHALSQRLFGAGSNVRNVRCFFSIHRGKFDTRIAR